MIRCLPTEVQGKLRSGVAIPSLQQCVEELLLNSIDAGATCVGVRIDMEAFKVQVIDNGSGIPAEDMERVGMRYHTSKCSCVDDLENLRCYGFRGEALASIVSSATLVEISSRTRLSVKTHVKVFRDGQGMDVFEAETSRPSAGTTVIVCNFFHNMPVRRKRVDAVLEGERIRQRVEAVSLMHPAVSFTLKNDCTAAMLVRLPKARDTHHRFVQIHSLARAEKLGRVSHAHEQFEVSGYLGKEGHYNSSLQYLYVNERLLLRTRIHKLLNCLLRRLGSAGHKQQSPDGTTATRSPNHKRSQDQYGVYVVNIKCAYSEYDICLEPAKTLVEFKDWDGVLLCVEGAVNAFLRRENLVSLCSREDLDCVSPRGSGVQSADPKEESEAAGREPAMDCCIGPTLASNFVYRRSAKDSVHPESDLCGPIADGAQQDEDAAKALDEPEKTPQRDLEHTQSDDDDGEEAFTKVTDNLDGPSGEQRPQKIGCDSRPPAGQTPTCQFDVNSNEQVCQRPVRKIGLSDPYVHQSLQIQDPFPSRTPQVQDLAPNREEKAMAPKRKEPPDSNKDGAAVLPAKIPRAGPAEKLSTLQPSGSLDKFRQTYCRSAQSRSNAISLRTSSFAKNPASLSAFGNKRDRLGDKGDRLVSQSPATRTDDNKSSKTSLAAKLCRLRRHTSEDADVAQHRCGDASQDQTRLGTSAGVALDRADGENPQSHGLPVDPSLDGGRQHELDGGGCSPARGDWLHHYEASVGKTVYVNRKTGLSRYEEPASDETQVPCRSDVSNMAVSVISEMGVEYRCYPFQLELVLPFLPKSRQGRVISSGTDCKDEADESSNSLSSMYSKWKNPVFVLPPTVAVDISSGQADGLAVKIHNILFPYRFSKNMIHSMKVVNQVDKKFLACLINARDEDSAARAENEGNLLVLVDQHAAHERVRLENLVADSYEDDTDAAGGKRLCSSTISPPLTIGVTEEELRLLRSSQPHLRNLGLEVTFSKTGAPQVFVGKVPLCFMEKESNELRRGRPSVIKPVVEEYLREQTELLRLTGRVRGTLPLTVMKVLASLACHGAIKFNDPLSRDECHSLVASLSSCQLPFQCAHGRPSIVPLVDVLHLNQDQKDFQKPNLQKLRRMYKAWELYGNK
ncbi:LOW QUALITY PROTEIN: DNA mismatch repair protein Mlh3 [Fundulus heteroclitus]|uniref:LOW QUALITY PROTEIN: DNA mismatch repair protein Mlh3 n=1 Tax=Fundulus heteroclitus TaxID=8078 RepID=UPI00165A730A|nr:LOW QUALITY PROTEIN: DNA mismatch repair protein Mlh3 [Fundulus heteroclitus]